MKKKIVFLAAVLCCTTSLLWAQSADSAPQDKTSGSIIDKFLNDPSLMHIRLDTRIDYQSLFSEGANPENTFRGNTFKLWIVGEITPGIRYRLRHRLNRTQASGRDAYGPATDQAFFEFDVKDKLTFRVGRQSVQFGTFEYDYNPADVYLPTMCFDDLDAYKTGVNVAYKVAGQVFNLQLVNSDAPQFASAAYARKAMGGLFLWEGSFFKDMLKTRYGVAAFQYDGTEYNPWITLGSQLTLGKLTADLDWYYGKRYMDTEYADHPLWLWSNKVSDNSFSVNLQYNMGKFRPAIKCIYDDRKYKYDSAITCVYEDPMSEKGSLQNFGLQAVMEYYPFEEGRAKDLRFHAMYSYRNTSGGGKLKDIPEENMHTILVGLRWMFNVR